MSRKRKTHEDWIIQLNKKHNNFYDYIENIISSKQKIKIKCPKHGIFEQRVDIHLFGSGCNKCGISKSINLNTKNNDLFIKQSNLKHNNLYNYSKTIYKHSEDSVIIICNKHGEFKQQANSHLQGYGCPKCSQFLKNKLASFTNNQFLHKANLKHNNFYSYPEEYENSIQKIKIKCPKHGIFKQLTSNHLRGSGCPKCFQEKSFNKISKLEQEIVDFIKSLDINNIQQSNRNILNNKELDIFLPDYNIAIEFNGLHWHSDIYKETNYHLQKTIECNNLNIILIQIFEDEWVYKKDIVKNNLRNILNKNLINIKIENCSIKEINEELSSKFFNENNIQNFIKTEKYIGLFLDDNLISLMSFDKNKIIQFSNKINYVIENVNNKLIEFYLKFYKYKNLIVKLDRRWFNENNIYNKIGFKILYYTEPDYYFVKNNLRLNKNNIGCEFPKIYDCGYLIYKL